MGRCTAKLSLGLALARRLGCLGFGVRVGVGRLTWRLRQSLRAVCSSRVSGPGRDKAKAQSGEAQEVVAPRGQGARSRSRAPTLPAGRSSPSSPAMARRERCSGAAHSGSLTNTARWVGPGPGALPARPRPTPSRLRPQSRAERGLGGAYRGAHALGSTLQLRPQQKQPVFG